MASTATARATASRVNPPGSARDLGRVGEQLVVGEKLRAELAKTLNILEGRIAPILASPKPTNGGVAGSPSRVGTDNIAARIEHGNLELQSLIAAVQDITSRVDL